jgi:hypothetical protein
MDSKLETLQQILRAATEGMSETDLNWHPEGKWCTAEVLEHLYLTYTGTIKGFERMLDAGKPNTTPASLKHRLRSLVVFGFNYLPPGRKSPQQAMPGRLPREKVRAEVGEKIGTMGEVIRQSELRFGLGPILDHPILGPLTAEQWRRFHLIHGRHHEKQIERLREQMRAAEH